MTASVVLFDGRSAAHDPTFPIKLETARRRSKFVRSFKRTLMFAMVVLGAAVGFFVVLSAINPAPAIDASQVGGQVRMVNPRFTGRDEGGTPFVISAQSAERPESGSQTTELAFPRLEFATGVETPAATVQADRGVFDQTARTLDLIDGVRFSTDNGYLFRTDHALVYVDDGRVVGDRVIMGEGPLGSIRAQTFEIRNSGDSVLFSGEVTARLYPGQPSTPAEAAIPAETAADIVAAPGAAPAPAQTEETAVSPAQLSRQGGPIDITANSTEFVTSESVNRWVGDVSVRQGDAQLTSDLMNIYFTETEDDGAREIERIEVEGSVVYITPTEIARGRRGVYLASSERIVLTGEVTVIRGDTTLAGDELVIDPRQGRSALSSDGSNTDDGEGRVRGVLGRASGAASPPPDSD